VEHSDSVLVPGKARGNPDLVLTGQAEGNLDLGLALGEGLRELGCSACAGQGSRKRRA